MDAENNFAISDSHEDSEKGSESNPDYRPSNEDTEETQEDVRPRTAKPRGQPKDKPAAPVEPSPTERVALEGCNSRGCYTVNISNVETVNVYWGATSASASVLPSITDHGRRKRRRLQCQESSEAANINKKKKEADNNIHVWTGSARINNDRGGARAGYGVYFGPKDKRNSYGPLADDGGLTSQRAELVAIKCALKMITDDDGPVVIHTTSTYSIQCMTKWLENWRRNGFRKKNGESVKNRDLIKDVGELMRKRGDNVEFESVPG